MNRHLKTTRNKASEDTIKKLKVYVNVSEGRGIRIPLGSPKAFVQANLQKCELTCIFLFSPK